MSNMLKWKSFKVGGVYELINCSTTFTTFSELSLLRGERQYMERTGREPEKKEKEMTEKPVEEILLTGDLHSERMGHLPSAFQPSVLTRVKMIIILPPPLALGLVFGVDENPPPRDLSLSVRVILKALQTDSTIPLPSHIRINLYELKRVDNCC